MGVRRVGLDSVLRKHGVPAAALSAAQQHAAKHGVSLQRALHLTPGIDPTAVARALSELSGLPLVDAIEPEHLDPEVVRPLRHRLADEHGVLPLYISQGQVVVAVADLESTAILDDIRVLLGQPIRPVLVPSDLLKKTLTLAYEKARESASSVLEDAEDEEVEEEFSLDDADLVDDTSDAVIIRFVNALLAEAIKDRASDIHIEPFEKDVVVRFRIDGVLHERHRPPPRFKSSIVSRIKIMAGMNIAEKRLPQDGRISKRLAGREIDLRVSVLPVRHGERVVMRLLEKGEVFSIDRIGMDPVIVSRFRELIHKPHGILLVSGPTGSGKSTTLYSAISEINSQDKNILTIEDPVEYDLHGIGQVQVNSKIDLTFASALRSFLRQDPDVILVGEIRDRETSENAVQAALTGHLVFSTIHTNDAAGSFVRLTEMGIEPYLVADSILAILAQRLLRRLCATCKVPHHLTDAELGELGITRADFPHSAWQPSGQVDGRQCKECGGTGYRGRVGVFELLMVEEEVKQLVVAGREAGAIKRAAVARGMLTLRDDGLRKVAEGVTSFQEVLRVTREDSE